MIQRIQTIFYLVALLIVALPLLGMEIFSFSNEDVTYHFTLFGNTRELFATNPLVLDMIQLPLFWGNVILIVLLLFTIILYKNLRLQLRLGRFVLMFYLVFIIGLFVAIYFNYTLLKITDVNVNIGSVLYLMIAGIPFVWLGNRGVNKDRKLLNSMDRLR
ncbi:MAG: hypothetical protein A3D31_04755 [Candidatus Fluviicola riflensis]|nr:MAG: hypothetical protein CHH17_10265 [Candidatus Fluviicola riflensis]OGS79286.1 MAG: hypothetical protein A3D31_04755 [Candidatus Fluviicola riflensis]OGS86718.1 MAG: hypothetical protein A2724_04215 [Fluviicola sp. RIFCSPHIGHO2_01_FULL_43_53]OGS88808.1 MAG: hypothetical protein A3E30_00445 [Fluviicola sp. RIFCSPHIGHO2_12_FULL_43_24]